MKWVKNGTKRDYFRGMWKKSQHIWTHHVSTKTLSNKEILTIQLSISKSNAKDMKCDISDIAYSFENDNSYYWNVKVKL